MVVSAMEYQSRKVVLRKDRKSWDVSPTPACAFRLRELHDHAAMVFEEAASLSYQLGQRWTQASALVPKAPAHSEFSHSGAQTHRLSNQQARPHLSHV